ncbi:ArsR/SmtB family transcription factor [Halobaculum sp. MBLA0147]|uniref:ArsR/SmtB family transcription factor n=1 Tax=Halobaculum sp. MBLA0147 TaxID=3079934 RepID=UPI003523B3D0
MTDPTFVEQTDPDEVFSLLADETRVEILRALWADDGEATFSELRAEVGMRDSGQFNYHLDKLVGRFVTRTDDAYELTQAGMQINGAIAAGAYTAAGSIDPIELPESCPACGGERTLHYGDETVRVACGSCPVEYRVGVPPAVFVGCNREDVPRVASQYVQTTFHQLTSGFCAFCDGPATPTVELQFPTGDDGDGSAEASHDPDSDGISEESGPVPLARYTCHQCGAEPTLGLPHVFVDHPAVVGFYYDRGVDVRERSVWAFGATDPGNQSVRGRDPLRVSVTYECEGDTLTLVIDDTVTVTEIEE